MRSRLRHCVEMIIILSSSGSTEQRNDSGLYTLPCGSHKIHSKHSALVHRLPMRKFFRYDFEGGMDHVNASSFGKCTEGKNDVYKLRGTLTGWQFEFTEKNAFLTQRARKDSRQNCQATALGISMWWPNKDGMQTLIFAKRIQNCNSVAITRNEEFFIFPTPHDPSLHRRSERKKKRRWFINIFF